MQTKPFDMESVSPSMKALLAAVEMLKQTGKPVTSTGQNTFTQQVVQAAEGQQQPPDAQQPPADGQPVEGAGEPPSGMPAAMQMAEQAAPTQANNAQEAQTQQAAQQAAQMLQQQQQQQQPQQPEGGIAGLPSNVKPFKDGGVVGYAVGGDIPVGEATPAEFGYLPDDEIKKLPPELQKEYYRQKLAARSAAQSKLAGIAERMATRGGKGALLGARRGPYGALLGGLAAAIGPELISSLSDKAQQADGSGEYKSENQLNTNSDAPDHYMAADAMGKSPTFDIKPGSNPMKVAEALQTAYNQEADPRKKEMIKAKIIELVGQTQSTGGQNSGGGGGGGDAPAPAKRSIERPTAEQAAAWAKTITPTADMSQMEQQVKELQDFLKTRPDTAGDRTAALKQAYEEELASRPAEDQIRRWTMAADAARRGDYGGFGDAVIYNRERATKADALQAEGLAALKDKAFADQTGDKVKSLEAEEKLRNIRKEYDTLLSEAGRTATSAMTNMYSSDVMGDTRQYAADARGAGRPDHMDIVDKIHDNVEGEVKEWVKNHQKEIRKNPNAIENEKRKIALREVAKYKAIKHPDAAAIEETILAEFSTGAAPKRYSISALP
jgi:hypothetical protein